VKDETQDEFMKGETTSVNGEFEKERRDVGNEGKGMTKQSDASSVIHCPSRHFLLARNLSAQSFHFLVQTRFPSQTSWTGSSPAIVQTRLNEVVIADGRVW